MPWPVLPYGFIGGARKNAALYGRQPPEILNILVVGGGGDGNYTTGNGGAAGGGGGVYVASVLSGALLSSNPVYTVVVGGRGAESKFALYSASGGETPSGCTGGAQGLPNGYGGGGGYGYGSGVNAGSCGGGAGGSHSGSGVGSRQIGADFYLGYALDGYAVGSIISSLIGGPYVGVGGRGAWTSPWGQTNQARYLDSGGQGAGGGGPRGNAYYPGCGGGGGGGLGTAGVVVVSYEGTQAGPGGSVTYISSSNTTYHVFTSDGVLEL